MNCVEQYNPLSARKIIDAYADGLVNNSLNVIKHPDLQAFIPANRNANKMLFQAHGIQEASKLHDERPQLLLAVGGMAVGKTSFIESLNPFRYYKPSRYRDFIPEYAALTEHGKKIPVSRYPEAGQYAAEHAGRFITEERLQLKYEAIAVAALQGCSVALETHPNRTEIQGLRETASQYGLAVFIIGMMCKDIRTAQSRAATRALLSDRPVSMDRVALTHEAMQTEWPDIASLGESQLLYT